MIKSQSHPLKNKRTLITAGPTWVPIDSVRVISNIATGETGILLANEARKQGAKVTLLLGPVGRSQLDKSIKVIRFNFFDELKYKLMEELRSKKYDIAIHSAAVADYKLKKTFNHKINSGLKNLNLKLIPAPKIIEEMKKINQSLFLVGFKFSPQTQKKRLINQARSLIKYSDADLVVANTVYKGRYNAYIVNQAKVKGVIYSKNKLTKILIRQIGEMLCQNLN